MNKITLFLLLVISTISLVSCEEKFGPDVDPTPAEATITGKWSFKSLGTITDKKTYELTLDDIRKIPGTNTSSVDSISNTYAYEFKTDSTYLSGTDSGNWKSSSDGKTIVLTSKVTKGMNGKYQVQTLSVLTLTSNELVLGYKKFTADADGDFNATTFEDFVYLAMGGLALQYKGTEQEAKSATSIQGTINLKR